MKVPDIGHYRLFPSGVDKVIVSPLENLRRSQIADEDRQLWTKEAFK